MLPNEIMSKIVCLTKRYEKCPYKSNLFTPKSTISFKMKYLTVFSLLILFSSANCEGNGTVRGCAGKPLSKIDKPIQIYSKAKMGHLVYFHLTIMELCIILASR